jgi:hypothetical protein
MRMLRFFWTIITLGLLAFRSIAAESASKVSPRPYNTQMMT